MGGGWILCFHCKTYQREFQWERNHSDASTVSEWFPPKGYCADRILSQMVKTLVKRKVRYLKTNLFVYRARQLNILQVSSNNLVYINHVMTMHWGRENYLWCGKTSKRSTRSLYMRHCYWIPRASIWNKDFQILKWNVNKSQNTTSDAYNSTCINLGLFVFMGAYALRSYPSDNNTSWNCVSGEARGRRFKNYVSLLISDVFYIY